MSKGPTEKIDGSDRFTTHCPTLGVYTILWGRPNAEGRVSSSYEEETVFFSQLGVSPRAGGLETLGVADFFTAFESPGQQLSNEPSVARKF